MKKLVAILILVCVSMLACKSEEQEKASEIPKADWSNDLTNDLEAATE